MDQTPQSPRKPRQLTSLSATLQAQLDTARMGGQCVRPGPDDPPPHTGVYKLPGSGTLYSVCSQLKKLPVDKDSCDPPDLDPEGFGSDRYKS